MLNALLMLVSQDPQAIDIYLKPGQEMSISNVPIAINADYGDINNDGYNDVMFLNGFIVIGQFPSAQVAINNGGQFSSRIDITAPQTFGELGKHCTIADLDGNRELDYLIAPIGTNGQNYVRIFYILTINGARILNFLDIPFTPTGLSSFQPSMLCKIDIDNNGSTEAIVGFTELTVLPWSVISHGCFIIDFSGPTYIGYGWPTYTDIEVIDINQDGWQDLVMADMDGSVYKVINSGGTLPPTRVPVGAGMNLISEDMTIGNIDGDTTPDILVCYQTDSRIDYYSSLFGRIQLNTQYYGITQIELSNMDNDNIDEVILCGLLPSTTQAKPTVIATGKIINGRYIEIDSYEVEGVSLGIPQTGLPNTSKQFLMVDIDRDGTKDCIWLNRNIAGQQNTQMVFMSNHPKFKFTEKGYSNPGYRQIYFSYTQGHPFSGNDLFVVKISNLIPSTPFALIIADWEMNLNISGNLWIYPGLTGLSTVHGLISDQGGQWIRNISGVNQISRLIAYAQVLQADPSAPYGIASSRELVFSWGD